jgi:hypothetical protein
VNAVDGYVAQPRLSAADLYVLAFAFIALQRNAGQPAHGIRDIGIWQAGDNLRRQHLHDVIGGLLDIDRLDLAPLTITAYRDRFILHADLEHGIHVGHTSCTDRHVGRKRREADIRDRELVRTRRQVKNCDLSLAIRYYRLPIRLQFHACPRQCTSGGIGDATRNCAIALLRIDRARADHVDREPQ